MFDLLKLQIEQLWREFTDHKAELREVRGDVRGRAHRDELSRVYTDIGEKEAANAERHRTVLARLAELEGRVTAAVASLTNLQESIRALAAVFDEEQPAKPAPASRKLNMQRVDWRILAFAFLAVGATLGKSAEMIIPVALSAFARWAGG